MACNCNTLYEKVTAEYPELSNKGLEVYCSLSGKAERLDGIHFYYGKNSLKWLIDTLSDKIEEEDLKQLFYGILTDLKALNKAFKDLEHNIKSFPSTRRYWNWLE
ncbi:MAG: hypothetical protein C0599_03300 [Salinivirgaceae bacterium]|nr:MAG: hypothetical protein C0599_03300 [Salinivirgaceae bacterium]